MKQWLLSSPDEKNVYLLARQCGLPHICASVLAARGIDTLEKVMAFFNCSQNGPMGLSDPFLIPDMDKASDIIYSAVNDGLPICIYGDYDCDGITATVLLYSFLFTLGADVTYKINMRDEGYGINCDAVRELAEKGTKLIITVDNGISALNEIALAKELGITVVVTDHHIPGETLPNADAIINPHLKSCTAPFKDLCGCAVVLKLIAAMNEGSYELAMEQCADLCTIATIADSVPLYGENREIVTNGLRYIENTENLGLKALMQQLNISGKLTSTDVAFKINPKINASGRFASASEAVELLLTDDPDDAFEKAAQLISLNATRQQSEISVMKKIEEMCNQNPELFYEKVLVLYIPDIHHGVVGICAARIMEKTGKPVFLMSDDGNELKGSARSFDFHVYNALNACESCLSKYGGHEKSGGFSLPKDKLDDFRRAMRNYSASINYSPVYRISADKLLSGNDINPQTVISLSALEPFGEQNKTPLFLIRDAVITGVFGMGSEADHTRIGICCGADFYNVLIFRQPVADFPYQKGDHLDIIASLSLSSCGGVQSVDLRAEDYRISGISSKRYFPARDYYESYKLGDLTDKSLGSRFVPAVDILRLIYKAILSRPKVITYDLLYALLDKKGVSYCMVRAAVDIFEELGLINQNIFRETVRVSSSAPQKIDIESSKILQKLRTDFNL